VHRIVSRRDVNTTLIPVWHEVEWISEFCFMHSCSVQVSSKELSVIHVPHQCMKWIALRVVISNESFERLMQASQIDRNGVAEWRRIGIGGVGKPMFRCSAYRPMWPMPYVPMSLSVVSFEMTRESSVTCVILCLASFWSSNLELPSSYIN